MPNLRYNMAFVSVILPFVSTAMADWQALSRASILKIKHLNSDFDTDFLMSDKYVIGNFKLNPATRAQAVALVEQIGERIWAMPVGCVLGVAPNFLHLDAVKSHAANNLWVGAQDVAHQTAQTGAFTGDVAAQLIADLGADFVIIGHSERRAYHGEDNAKLAQKIAHARAAGLKVIFCIGESREDYEAARTLAVLDEQLAVFADIQATAGEILIAYEPVWAIGTGLTPTLAEIEAVHTHIKATLADFGIAAPVLYGGSVNADNAGEFGTSALIDGALVGGASLKADSFLAIARAFS